MTHYQVLGVASTASAAELRQAYLRLARISHPDLEPDPARRAAAEDRMRSINQAWNVLGDSARRRAYDDELSSTRRAQRPVNSPSPDFVPLVDDDTDYAALLDDTPVEGTEVPRVLQLLPVVLLGIAVASLCVGLVTSFGPFIALGAVCLVLAFLAFLAAPALAVMQSHAQDPG